MKIPKDQVERVRKSIEPLDREEARENYRQGRFHNSDKVKDLNMRYRWDLYWACSERFEGDFLDSHIDTALRSIVPILEVK